MVGNGFLKMSTYRNAKIQVGVYKFRFMRIMVRAQDYVEFMKLFIRLR